MHVAELGVDISLIDPVEGLIVGAEGGIDRHVCVNEFHALHLSLPGNGEVPEPEPLELRPDGFPFPVGGHCEPLPETVPLIGAAILVPLFGKIHRDCFPGFPFQTQHRPAGQVLPGVVALLPIDLP